MINDPIQKLRERLRENRNSLNIARLPDKTKKEFIALANEEFVGDYGWTLKWCLEQALEYQIMKNTFFQNIDMKLDHILDNLPQHEETEEKPETKKIKLVNGRRIELKEVKNG